VIIKHNNQIFTDDSTKTTKDTIFVESKQNKQYTQDAQTNGAKIIQSKELINYFDFSPIKIVGITGTNGKTTTAGAIYSFLLDLGYKVALQGTRGFFINDTKIEDYSLTTPVQLENFAHIAQAIANQCDFFIMEVSSHAIAQNRIEGIEFALKAHTNITSDHLDYHKTLQDYINTKNSFFQDDTPKIINKDDTKIKFKLKNAYSYGMDNPATYKVQAYTLQNGISVALANFNNIVTFNTPLIGLFNIYNLTCAVASVHILTKKDLQTICDVVDNFAGVSGRMQVALEDPLTIVDFAHTPDGMKKVFESFASSDIIVVFGAGGDRDRIKRPVMGKFATEFATKIILTSDNPRFEDPDIIIDDILKGISTKEKVTIELNRKEAIKIALQSAKDYDNPVILVLGKGDEQYQIIYDKKFAFNDIDVIQQINNSDL
jgi:UDP-N-acetylmuramoyl-L-alanyl-D-glutamate--2,6-diaminopimelate ligase